jgi:hypothetical protein
MAQPIGNQTFQRARIWFAELRTNAKRGEGKPTRCKHRKKENKGEKGDTYLSNIVHPSI